jgi:uncharacterized membrane protein YfcA
MLHSVWLYPILFLTGLTAGVVDSIAGGGGLITLPIMLSAGMPPQIALGTNKFQGTFGSFTATYYYSRHHIVQWREAVHGIFFTAIGAAGGAYAVQHVDSTFLGKLIPFLLVAVLLYVATTPAIGERDERARMVLGVFYPAAGIALGFYDGFFGPGVGSFWAVAFVLALGFNLQKATGYTKLMNFTSNSISLAVFIAGGVVWFSAGIVMAAGQIIGSRLGAKLVIRKGVRFIKPVFLTVVFVTVCKLFYTQFFSH